MSSGAYAAVIIAEKNSVDSKSIKNKNVKTANIKPGAVKTKSLASNSVDSQQDRGRPGSAVYQGSGRRGHRWPRCDLSAAAKTDLNDANTLGGLTPAHQIVAASGGEYDQGQAGTRSASIFKTETAEVTPPTSTFRTPAST